MGIFNKIFGNTSEQKEEKVLPWMELNHADQIKTIQEKSKTKTQVIFKHSTRCGISRMAMNRFVDNYHFDESEIDLYYLDIIANREVSNETGYKFQVIHESPQLLVIKNGVVVAHASHGSISTINLKSYL